MKPPKKAQSKAKRGPKMEHFSAPCDWRQAIKRSFLKQKPKGGWPK
jgi:hypothetical protein